MERSEKERQGKEDGVKGGERDEEGSSGWQEEEEEQCVRGSGAATEAGRAELPAGSP